ncbi:hypothetical protein [Streptomyces cavernicola]|uniref:Uncharacterized protein n=1 Tax=Streptomyces cavernicola TaxID=3043613 RepID=A0ABT6S6Q4_9ACTN|nr:hypothetical protein [Streptomyces sp. B-S-A6]MDI3403695.1 hypothetical protein [Streptomyces sp. B-S-A6]
MNRTANVLTCAVWGALPAAALWWAVVALGTDGYDGELCGETGPLADSCLNALDAGRAWAPGFLLLALLLGLVLLALRRTTLRGSARVVLALAALLSLVAGATALTWAWQAHAGAAAARGAAPPGPAVPALAKSPSDPNADVRTSAGPAG